MSQNTSLIMGLATENIPIPPIAVAVKVTPNKWNWRELINNDTRY
jgi:hypothetical protein